MNETTALAFITNLGPTEITVVCVVAFLLFGGKQLPKFAKGVAEAVREFRNTGKAIEDELKGVADEDK